MKNSIELLNQAADNIRILAASAVENAKSGHPGGAMGGADFICIQNISTTTQKIPLGNVVTVSS